MRMRCTACGAGLGPNDLACAYCGQQTPLGAAHALHLQQQALHVRAHEVYAQHAQAQQRLLEQKTALEKTARHALLWSAAGLVFCCTLLPSVVGLVLSLRARRLAQQSSLVLPTSATLALLLSGLGLLLGVVTLVFGALDERRRSERIAAIDTQLGQAHAAVTLSHTSACLLTERRLLSDGYADSRSLDLFECDGRLEQNGDRARLEGVRAELGSNKHVLEVCFERAERWRVIELGVGLACDAGGTLATHPSPPAPTP